MSLPLAKPPKENENVFNQIAEVTQYLYLSAATAMTPSAMSNLSPSLVINVTKELPMLPMSSNATCIRLEVSDTETEEIFTHLYHVTTLIRKEAESGGRVLIHCVAGVSRSVTLVLAYLIRYYCDLSYAWQHLKTIRPWIRPNNNFMQQLRQWEISVQQKTSKPIRQKLIQCQ